MRFGFCIVFLGRPLLVGAGFARDGPALVSSSLSVLNGHPSAAVLVVVVAAIVCGWIAVSVMGGLVFGTFAWLLVRQVSFVPTLGVGAAFSWNGSVLWVAFLLVGGRDERR